MAAKIRLSLKLSKLKSGKLSTENNHLSRGEKILLALIFIFWFAVFASSNKLRKFCAVKQNGHPSGHLHFKGEVQGGLDPGGILGTFGWGCATGTLKPLPYTRPLSAPFCHPILD